MKRKTPLLPFALLGVALLASCAAGGASSSVSVPSSSPASSSPASSSSASSSPASSSSSSTSVAPAVTFSAKATDFYALSPANKKNFTLYFTASEPDIPFVEMGEITEFFTKESLLPLAYTLSSDGTIGTFASGDYTLVFDYAQKVITIADYQHFFAGGKSFFLEVMSLMLPDAQGVHHYLERSETSINFASGASRRIDLSSYDLPIYPQAGKTYVPLNTYSDFFLNPYGVFLTYNSKAAFLANDMSAFASLYYTDEVKGSRSASLAEYTYHEFCANMDNNYGLKESHGIVSMDDFVTRTGFKNDMLSSDASISSTAYSKFILGYFDDSHSGVNLSSYLAGNLPMIKNDYFGPSMTEKSNSSLPYLAARKAVYGDTIKPYEVVGGDTAIITFDSFATSTSDYYSKTPTEEDAGKDTMALVSFANAQIAANSAIKNVVLDLSLNGGGALDAAGYLLSWMLGGVTIHSSDPFDGAKASVTYYGDTNLDGQFNESDFLSGKKLYCLTTMTSFSCGNLVPSLFKESGAVTLLGRTSGGGACVVGHSCLADGTIFQYSSPSMLCTRKNGSYYSVDQGVAPDVVIDDPATFYDRTALRTKIESL
jgi:hypothetical protein